MLNPNPIEIIITKGDSQIANNIEIYNPSFRHVLSVRFLKFQSPKRTPKIPKPKLKFTTFRQSGIREKRRCE